VVVHHGGRVGLSHNAVAIEEAVDAHIGHVVSRPRVDEIDAEHEDVTRVEHEAAVRILFLVVKVDGTGPHVEFGAVLQRRDATRGEASKDAVVAQTLDLVLHAVNLGISVRRLVLGVRFAKQSNHVGLHAPRNELINGCVDQCDEVGLLGVALKLSCEDLRGGR
jgi:hypothetical protein